MTLLIAAVLFSLLGVVLCSVLSIQLLIEVKAMKGSTHQVQFIRSGEFETLNEELKSKLMKNDYMDAIQ